RLTGVVVEGQLHLEARTRRERQLRSGAGGRGARRVDALDGEAHATGAGGEHHADLAVPAPPPGDDPRPAVPGVAVVEVEHGTPAAGAALEAVPDGAVGPVQAVAVAGDREPPDRLPAGQRRVRGELEQLVARTRAGLGPHPLDPLGLG